MSELAEDIIKNHPDPSMIGQVQNPVTPFEVYSIDGTCRNVWINCASEIPSWTIQIITEETTWQNAEFLPETYDIPVGRILGALPDYYYPAFVAFIRQAMKVVTDEVRRVSGILSSDPGEALDASDHLRAYGRAITVLAKTQDRIDEIPELWKDSHEKQAFGNELDPNLRMTADELRDKAGTVIYADSLVLVTPYRVKLSGSHVADRKASNPDETPESPPE